MFAHVLSMHPMMQGLKKTKKKLGFIYPVLDTSLTQGNKTEAATATFSSSVVGLQPLERYHMNRKKLALPYF